MKDKNEVIKDFNNLVNMTSSELEQWLKSSTSRDAGWAKEADDGESIGHESGRKIIKILNENPDKKPDKYTDGQIAHMRKVVSYCKRHLAQESATNAQKSEEEVKKTKSYASLKNRGHDILKKQNGKQGKSANGDKRAGDKRSAQDDSWKQNKQAKTAKNSSAKTNGNAKSNSNKGQATTSSRVTRSSAKKQGDSQEEEEDKGSKGKKSGQQSKQANGNGPDKGETVSWNWGGGHPKGKVLDVKGDDTEITTHKGNKVSRKGKPSDPAVVLDTGKSKAIKLDHELD